MNQLYKRYTRLLLRDLHKNRTHLSSGRHISKSPTDQSSPQHYDTALQNKKKPILHPSGFRRGGVCLPSSKTPVPADGYKTTPTVPSARDLQRTIHHHHRGFPPSNMHIYPHEY